MGNLKMPQLLIAAVCIQMLKYSESTTVGKGHMLNMDNFIDTTNIEGRFEFSEWVRAYGKYLDEQLEVYHKISFYQVRGIDFATFASWAGNCLLLSVTASHSAS